MNIFSDIFEMLFLIRKYKFLTDTKVYIVSLLSKYTTRKARIYF